LYEGAGQVGGRCRSFIDSKLGIEIDNGNHIILSANSNFLKMCNLIGSENTLNFLGSTYNFFDCKNKKTWNVKIGENKFPLWIFNKNSRIPETRLIDYISIFKLLSCNKKMTVQEVIGEKNNLYKNFWEPLTLGILNTQCKEASAQLLKNVVKKTFLKGGKYSGIFQPKKSWDKTLINPMLNFLREKEIIPKYNSLLQKITIEKKKLLSFILKITQLK
jgi:protoporphyrinogen oxidase